MLFDSMLLNNFYGIYIFVHSGHELITGFRFGQRYRHGQLALKQLRLSVLNEIHTNSYTGLSLFNNFILKIVQFTHDQLLIWRGISKLQELRPFEILLTHLRNLSDVAVYIALRRIPELLY